MVKIFSCKSARSCRLRFLCRFTAGFAAEAGGAGRHPAAAAESGGDPLMLIQISAEKSLL